ncbi:MAG TPA: hypothetical protein VEY30_08845 [Myxococcaceae bacterium]|nr:hypothetical protein [Myxococcaceae bacterium]
MRIRLGDALMVAGLGENGLDCLPMVINLLAMGLDLIGNRC